MPALLWDIYCRVVDNLGDAGVCWRLAADLAGRGQRVRLVIDDAAPLRLIAPSALSGGVAGVDVFAWPGPAGRLQSPAEDVVIEAFGCEVPPAAVDAMAQRAPTAPVWVNLEYLSAEPFVERSHGLPSPQPGGLTKWFYFPGFTPRTGGLLREPGLLARRQTFDRDGWLAGHGVQRRPGERIVSLFCYRNHALPALLDSLAWHPTLLLLTQGPAQQQVHAAPHAVRVHRLPWLTQTGFDRMLWAADLNIVRGEDSLVRALWAGAPCIWQAYPQTDGAHLRKVDAMLAALAAPPDVAAVWRAWNRGSHVGDANTCPGDGAPCAWPELPALPQWRDACAPGRQALLAQSDLTTQLLAFVARAGTGRRRVPL